MDPNLLPEKAPSPKEDDGAGFEGQENLPHPDENTPYAEAPPSTEQSPASDTIGPVNVYELAEDPVENSAGDSVDDPVDDHIGDPVDDPLNNIENVENPHDKVSVPTDENETEANSSVANVHLTSVRSFATPLKLLPPLKDIEHITTPKSFDVARDETHLRTTFKSTPMEVQNSMQLGDPVEVEEDAFDNTANDTFANAGGQPKHDTHVNATKAAEIEAATTFLDVHPQVLWSGDNDLVAKVAQRAQKFLQLQSELSFFKLNQEQMNQVQLKKHEQVQRKLEILADTNRNLLAENETGSLELLKRNDAIAQLRNENFALSEKVQFLEMSIQESRNGSSSREHEYAHLNETVNTLTRSSAEQGQKISDLTRELNDSTNEVFSFKLELSKATNELSYMKSQKAWYESQLKSVQEKYTDLIKRHDTDSLKDSNKIASLSTQAETLAAFKDSLQTQVKELQEKFEKASMAKYDWETKLEVLNSRFAKESTLKNETIELLNIQLQEKNDRIVQLESFAEDLKSSTTDSVGSLQRSLAEKEDRIAQVEEKLRRAEEALDSELHKETKLPKLAPSAELILQESSLGISLSTLYTEFNHMKKELILQKSQKEKLSSQLQHFIAELESKKPAIANYRNQILYYESTLKEVLAKMESVRIEKVDSEKECIRLRTRLASHENEILSIKQLSKDLGRQLCFYLIHSKIREGNEEPLSSHEKKVIDQILAKSGNNDGQGESDMDQLITERLIGFASIIDLQKKNEELTVAVRLLGKQLEEKDTEPNGFEAAAVEEAKEAILTLQSELESITLKCEAVSKERDLIKSLNGGPVALDENKVVLRVLQEANADLKNKVQDGENVLREIQAQSEAKIRALNDSLLESKTINDDLKVKVSTAKHSVEFSESRLENSNKLLENTKREREHFQKETAFWREQASRQENLLVNKSNELRDAEHRLLSLAAMQNSLRTEKEVWTGLQVSLSEEIQHLKSDKYQLNSFVFNLQALLKERELSSVDLSKKLTQSVENYQALQDKMNEKEDRIMILSTQSDMALRAQNAKLEQMNELNEKLLEARSKLADKQAVIDKLRIGLSEKTSARKASIVPTHSSTDDDSPVLASEYNDLKDALKDAEAQVAEFSDIAKSAEDALMKATESFDDFREASSGKLILMEEEKAGLVREADSQKKRVEDLQKQLRQHDLQTFAQIQNLQTQLQESSLKAASYDEMKTDYEEKLSSIGQDMQNQISISGDLQRRYDSKSSEAEVLNSQLAQQKEKATEQNTLVEELSTRLGRAEADLRAKDERLAEVLSAQQEDLRSAQIKVRDLQYQYDLALTQLELQKPFSQSEDPQSGDNFRQVIGYLRAEKEAAESRAILAADQVAQLNLQLGSVSAELKAVKSQLSRLQSMKLELDSTNKEHARLMEQLEQLNILRESNSTLRKENSLCLEKIRDLQAQIDALPKTIPSDDTSAQADVQVQEIRLLKEENERLKNLPNNAEELERLKQRFENLKSEFLAKLVSHRNKNRELERELHDIKLQLETTLAELLKAKASTGDNEKTSSLAARLKQAETEKAEAETKFAEEITSLKSEFEKQKAEANAAFKAKLAEDLAISAGSTDGSETRLREKLEAESKQKLEKSTADLKAKFEKDTNKVVELRVKERLQQMKKEDLAKISAAQDRLKKEYEGKIRALNQGFDKQLAEEKANAEKAAGTKYEFKLKVLNRKLEKYEKEREATPPSVASSETQNSSSQQPTKPNAFNQHQASHQHHQNHRNHQNHQKGAGATLLENGDSTTAETPGSEIHQGSKRPLSQGNPPSVNFKRSKD